MTSKGFLVYQDLFVLQYPSGKADRRCIQYYKVNLSSAKYGINSGRNPDYRQILLCETIHLKTCTCEVQVFVSLFLSGLL